MGDLRILLVDDNQDLADGLADVLDLYGYETSVLYTAEDALKLIGEEAPFDLIFMDIKLPGISGIDALPEIRQLAPQTRVILMTGFRIDQVLSQALDGGAVKVLRKPFSVDEVLMAIADLQRAGIVLVADDDPDFAASLEDALTGQHYDVLVASDGRQAVDRILNESVDVLVLDLHLPILDGLQVYLEIKKHGRAVPTILVTGHREEKKEEIDILHSLSVTGCLFKPFSTEILLKEIEHLCGEAKTLS